jgi:hypothetical protein
MKKLYHIAVLLLFLISSCEEARNDPDLAASLEGEWKVDESSSQYKSRLQGEVYYVEISLSPEDSTTLYISNFYNVNPDAQVVANLEGTRLNLMADQQITRFQSTYTVKGGSGEIATDYQSISWEYQVDDGSGMVDDVTAIYTRPDK